MSGLRVNFDKCKLYGINASLEELTAGANLLGCDIEKGQFVYLGMRIGINNHRKENWAWLIQNSIFIIGPATKPDWAPVHDPTGWTVQLVVQPLKRSLLIFI